MTKRIDHNRVIARLAATGAEMFTLNHLRELLHLTDKQAYQLGHQLARKNLVRRVKPGLYAILQPADWERGLDGGIDRFWAATRAVRDEAHYLAYYTAMELHEMIQHPLRTVFVATEKAHRTLTLGKVAVRFIKLAMPKIFGDEEVRTAQGHIVKVAQLERTFIDGVDRPDLCGGIDEIFRGFVRRRHDLDADRLLRFVARLDKPVTTKRLGFLLEIAGADPELVMELERATPRLKRFTLLDKTAPTTGGERNRRWELIVNTDVRGLFNTTRT